MPYAFRDHDPDPDPDPATLLTIVVGAHLAAEIVDRPIAGQLADEVARRSRRIEAAVPLQPVVVTDIWYLNTPALRIRPTVCIGSPDVNAACAFWATRVPTALLCENAYRILLDPEYVLPQACLWGTNTNGTVEAVRVFTDRYLDGFLESAHLGSIGELA